ncbi:hypothetical protein KDK95_24735 [Actinospica sp. MGRD01-02]|uniref:ACT domain-containing protein n=1 Tax=Actinospica acidithermotolerans TaxID=2828514 RepID=A0A941EB37_9ACTN|nr:hypothetical protein [Actinospica acidithermotolerans]MBR7829535.1 hypothetical protein [Actinospica acidithermotolerans]
MTSRNPNHHHRHLVELASLLATAGLADAFADVFGLKRHGSTALIALGVALVVGTVGHHIWLRRRDHAPPALSTEIEVSPTGVTTASPADGGSTSVFWRVRAEIDNTPGRLAVLAGALTAAGANIHALEVHPAPDGVIDQFLIEASEDTSAERLCAAVNAVGGRYAHAVPTDVLALLDGPTHALELAARLVREPGSFAAVFTEMLDAGSLTIDAAGPAATHTANAADAWIDGTTLTLRTAAGTTLTATRPGMPFTATELSRARTLLELSEAASATLEV